MLSTSLVDKSSYSQIALFLKIIFRFDFFIWYGSTKMHDESWKIIANNKWVYCNKQFQKQNYRVFKQHIEYEIIFNVGHLCILFIFFFLRFFIFDVDHF